MLASWLETNIANHDRSPVAVLRWRLAGPHRMLRRPGILIQSVRDSHRWIDTMDVARRQAGRARTPAYGLLTSGSASYCHGMASLLTFATQISTAPTETYPLGIARPIWCLSERLPPGLFHPRALPSRGF